MISVWGMSEAKPILHPISYYCYSLDHTQIGVKLFYLDTMVVYQAGTRGMRLISFLLSHIIIRKKAYFLSSHDVESWIVGLRMLHIDYFITAL